jgi:vacuolar iron transporter family protein
MVRDRANIAGHHSLHHHRMQSGGLARAAVFGISDGLVSNVSLVLGFAGGGASSAIVRLAGIAGLIGGAFSMAAGEYISVASQNELVDREIELERRSIAENPRAEHAELAQIYVAKGVPIGRARALATDLMSDPEMALATHAREELGVDTQERPSAWGAAISSFVSFAVGAFAPVVPWFIGSGDAATIASIIIGVVAAIVVGAVIGRFAERSMAKSAARQALILVVACAATYAIGSALGVSVT